MVVDGFEGILGVRNHPSDVCPNRVIGPSQSTTLQSTLITPGRAQTMDTTLYVSASKKLSWLRQHIEEGIAR